jgi:hypothetical protein
MQMMMIYYNLEKKEDDTLKQNESHMIFFLRMNFENFRILFFETCLFKYCLSIFITVIYFVTRNLRKEYCISRVKIFVGFLTCLNFIRLRISITSANSQWKKVQWVIEKVEINRTISGQT